MERKKNFYIIFAAVAFCVVFSADIYNSIQSYRYRKLCDKYRTELDRTEEANRELTNRIGRVAEITERIREATDANITDARDIIETVEILRVQIKEMEDCCGSFNQSEYYQYWDSCYLDEGLMD